MDTEHPRTPSDEALRAQSLDRLATAGARLTGARTALDEADAELDAAIERAREMKVAHAQIQALAGISEAQLKWRLQRGDGREQIRAKARNVVVRQDRSGPRLGEGPGVSVTEAARRLGVTRKTVYARIERGELKATRNAVDQTRVLLDE